MLITIRIYHDRSQEKPGDNRIAIFLVSVVE